MGPNICRKINEDDFFRSHIFVGENLLAKVAQQLFGQVWERRAKILRTPKHFLASAPTIYHIVECHLTGI